MVVESSFGIIKMLRISSEGWDFWGAGIDQMQVEVIALLDTEPNKAFGLELKGNKSWLSSQLAMLSVLRDAYLHQLQVQFAYDSNPPGKTTYILKRVQFGQ